MPNHLLASVEVCELLQIDRSTLVRWVAAKRIAVAFRLPGPAGAYLFDPDEVERVRTAQAQTAS